MGCFLWRAVSVSPVVLIWSSRTNLFGMADYLISLGVTNAINLDGGRWQPSWRAAVAHHCNIQEDLL
jgi:hypothetical protein